MFWFNLVEWRGMGLLTLGYLSAAALAIECLRRADARARRRRREAGFAGCAITGGGMP